MHLSAPNQIKKGTTLYCFSPAVMLATFTIEGILAIYTFWKYRHTTFGRLSLLILICLTTFQLAEFNICTGPSGSILPWTKLGLVAITLLPALGVHLASILMGQSRLLVPAYLAALALATGFVYFPEATQAASCTGNYVILNNHDTWYLSFGLYYWFFLIGLLIEIQHKLTTPPKLNRRTRTLLTGIAIGYLTFIAPMAVVYTISPDLLVGVASIMCGFAVIWAILLGTWLTPHYHTVLAKSRFKQKRQLLPLFRS